jgi:hypothetical protein
MCKNTTTKKRENGPVEWIMKKISDENWLQQYKIVRSNKIKDFGSTNLPFSFSLSSI